MTAKHWGSVACIAYMPSGKDRYSYATPAAVINLPALAACKSLTVPAHCNGTQQAERIDDRFVVWLVTAIEVNQWPDELDRLYARFAGRFTRLEARRRALQ
ncbi:hypothetical protein J3R03_003141 [Actinoplanes couchii]|nr:hypothetical protein [Actinoplanes couchii]